MKEFFHGWRRKLGCVVLLVAIATAGLSMRSRFAVDHVLFTIGQRTYVVGAMRDRILLEWTDDSRIKTTFSYGTADADGYGYFTPMGEYLAKIPGTVHSKQRTLNYALITLPWTLLAALLLRPRRQQSNASQRQSAT